MFEPIIKTDLSMLPRTIETNLDELEPFIAEKCEAAKALVVSPDSIEECEHADADAALLSKMKDRVSRFRLDWTKSWQAPFEGVISKCKEYERRLAEAATDLREKSAVGKDKVKAAKRQALYEVYGRVVSEGGMDFGLPYFETFFAMMTDPKTKGNWLNKGVKPADAEAQMKAEVERCHAAEQTLKTMLATETPAAQTVALDALHLHFDMNEAAMELNSWKEQQKRIAAAEEAAKARAEAIRAAAAEKERAEASRAPSPVYALPTQAVMTQAAPESPKLETYRLAVTGTRAALVELKKWGVAHGIQFKNLDK